MLLALACGMISGLAAPVIAELMVGAGVFPREGESFGISSDVASALVSAVAISALGIACLRRNLHLYLLALMMATPAGVVAAIDYRFATFGIDSNLFPIEIVFWWVIVTLVFGLEYLVFDSIRRLSHRKAE